MTYRKHFDHLGNAKKDMLRISDLVICSIAFVVIAALFSGVLT